MAQLVKKTPMELFGSENVQVKPEYYSLRASRVDAPARNLPKDAAYPHYYNKMLKEGTGQTRVSYLKMANGLKGNAQKAANEYGRVYGTHDPKKWYLNPESERPTNPLPKSKVGPYGHVAFPEQWKYKTGTDLATAMTRAAKVDVNDEDSIWDAFESGKITEEQRNKMLTERSGKIANKGSDKNNGDGWKEEYEEDGYPNVDADYERSWGPVDTKEKYKAYLKWLSQGKK